MAYSISINPFVLPLTHDFAIHGYGITLCFALLVFTLFVYRHLKRLIAISFESISSFVVEGLFAGIIGGRLLHIFVDRNEYQHIAEIFQVWKGGLAILGAIFAVCLYIPYAFKKRNVKLFPAIDIAALYAPLGHAIGKLGCLWAGCCYGCPTNSFLSVQYVGNTIGAPLGVPLIPIQLYSALSFCVLFIILYCVNKFFINKDMPGTILLLYITGLCIERFVNDFWRSSNIANAYIFSSYQWLALVFGAISLIILIILVLNTKKI